MFRESVKVVPRMFQGYFKDVLRECQESPFLALYTTVKDSVSRLKVPRLSVLSRSRTKFWNWSHLGLVSDKKKKN